MSLENNNEYSIPLGELLMVLKARGYEVSIQRILEVQSVLLSSPVAKLKLADLKYIISPILSANGEDQKNIYKIIDQFIAEKTKAPEKKPSSFQQWLQKRTLVFRLKLAGFLLVVITGLLFYFLQRADKREVHSFDPRIKENINPVDPPITAKPKKTSNAPVPEVKKVETEPIDKPQYSGRAIIPTHPDISLQLAAAFGLGLGAILYYFLFYATNKRIEIQSQKNEPRGELTVEKPAGSGDMPPKTEHAGYTAIRFPGKDFLIQKSQHFSSIRTNLKKPVVTEYPEVNILESVNATARNAGFSSLVLDSYSRDPKYLFLIDEKEKDAHITCLLNFVIKSIAAGNIRVITFTYTTDITVLKDRNGNSTYLEDISHSLADHRLIITGNCDSLFMLPGLALLKDFTTIFQRWASRSIITPLAVPDWSYREVELQKTGFNVVPAEISTIDLLTKAIAGDASIKQDQLQKQISDVYSVSLRSFHSIDDVKTYLDNEALFQMLCSLAVYPKLDWSITLALFSALMNKKNDSAQTVKLDYDTLLKISRIPWLYKDKLGDTTRLQLFDHLTAATEMTARETILELLREMEPHVPPQSAAAAELDVQYKLNSFFLYAHDPNKYKKYAGVNNEILAYWDKLDEPALKKYVTEGKNSLMPATKEGASADVREFVLEEQRFEKTNVTFVKIVLLTVPAIVLYILLSLFRPGFIYLDTYDNVSFFVAVKKEGSCKQILTKSITYQEGKSDTQRLNSLHDVDYILVKDAEYARPLNMAVLSANGTVAAFSIAATDSLVILPVTCPR